MGIPDYLACLLINLYASQEAMVMNLYGTVPVGTGSNSSNPVWNKLIGSRLIKEYDRAIYCHPV